MERKKPVLEKLLFELNIEASKVFKPFIKTGNGMEKTGPDKYPYEDEDKAGMGPHIFGSCPASEHVLSSEQTTTCLLFPGEGHGAEEKLGAGEGVWK